MKKLKSTWAVLPLFALVAAVGCATTSETLAPVQPNPGMVGANPGYGGVNPGYVGYGGANPGYVGYGGANPGYVGYGGASSSRSC